MEQPFIPAGLEQLLQFAILLFVVVGFFRQFATQKDIKKLDDRLVKLENGQTELKAGQAALETRLGNVEAGQTALETRLGNVEAGQTALENRLDQVDTRLDRIEKKADAALDLHKTVQADIHVLQASVNRLDSYFETPKLKSS